MVYTALQWAATGLVSSVQMAPQNGKIVLSMHNIVAAAHKHAMLFFKL
jgi:hypothetical protein